MTKPGAALAESSIVIYGPAGCGKTTLATSAVEIPELGPVLVLDFENSTAAVADKYATREDLDVVQIREWEAAKRVLYKVLHTPHQYKTVVVDPINGLAHLLQMHMINRAETKRKLLIKESKGRLTSAETEQLNALAGVKLIEATNNSLGESTTSQADYGVLGTKMNEIIYAFNSAPFFSVLVTHGDYRRDKNDRVVGFGPDMPGNMAKKTIVQKPHVVAHMRKVTGKDSEGRDITATQIAFEDGKVGGVPFEAKSRLGLKEPLINASMSDLWGKMTGTTNNTSNSSDNKE